LKILTVNPYIVKVGLVKLTTKTLQPKGAVEPTDL